MPDRKSYSARIEELRRALGRAEHVVIGAGAGLSAAAGLEYGGRRFTDHFGDFIARYGFTDMYTSSFYPFRTEEERWAYWARHIRLNRYDTPATDLYRTLLRAVGGKDWFVITTNVDGQFEKAGFDRGRIFSPCRAIMPGCNAPEHATTAYITMRNLCMKCPRTPRTAASPPNSFPTAPYAADLWT